MGQGCKNPYECVFRVSLGKVSRFHITVIRQETNGGSLPGLDECRLSPASPSQDKLWVITSMCVTIIQNVNNIWPELTKKHWFCLDLSDITVTTKAGHGHQHQHEYMSSLMVVISQSLKDLSQIVQEEANVTIVVRASCTTPTREVNISIEYIVKQKKEEKKTTLWKLVHVCNNNHSQFELNLRLRKYNAQLDLTLL